MEYISDLGIILGVQVIVALGLYIQMATGQISAGQAAFMGIGGYAAGVASVRFNMPLAMTLLTSGLLAGLVAALFAALILRLSHWFLAVATLAFGEAMVVIIQNVDALGGAVGFFGIPLRTNLAWVLGVLAIVIYAMSRVESSRYGHAFRAVNQDEHVAESLGINTRRVRIVAFGVGGALAGIGGALTAQYVGIIESTYLGFGYSLPFLLYVAIGGTYTFWGTVVGTVVLLELPEMLRFTIYDRLLLYGLAMIVVMILRPQGLVTSLPRLEVLKSAFNRRPTHKPGR
jgi:branched-chain amino acid transport system permease protein